MPSRWARLRIEVGTVIRYFGAGAVNTALGVSVIFILTLLGAPTLIANAVGYLVGFAVGFVLAKNFVFGAPQEAATISRYTFAFLFCFVLNLCVVAFCENVMQLNALQSQAAGVTTYTISMYLISRYFVFRASRRG